MNPHIPCFAIFGVLFAAFEGVTFEEKANFVKKAPI